MYTFVCHWLGATDERMPADTVPPKIINFFFKPGCDKTLADSVRAYQLNSLIDRLDKHFCSCRSFVAQFCDTHIFCIELPRNTCARKLDIDEGWLQRNCDFRHSLD